MSKNTILLVAGISTLVQACIQFVLTTLAICQYFCVIDLLRELPLLLYIRILYFHNPSSCDSRIYIGQAIDGMADQAFVLVTSEALPTFRTFLINAVQCGLSIVWIATSGVLIHGGAKNNRSANIRWPWMAVMVVVFAVDMCATVAFITDTFRTRTLTELVDFVGGVLSGAGSQTLDTSLTAWLMVMIYSRFGVTILFNVFLVICLLVECGDRYNYEDEEAARMAKLDEGAGVGAGDTRIPRASLMRRIPTWLAQRPILRARLVRRRSPSLDFLPDSPDRTPPMRATDKHRVNFPPNLLSLPQRLETLMAEQQRRLDSTVVDTTGRSLTMDQQHRLDANVDTTGRSLGADQQRLNSSVGTTGRWSPNTGNSLPQQGDQPHTDAKGRRGTAAELQGQLPWSYIPASSHRMRDQLPPEEELPPVPVPDYTLHPMYRKACKLMFSDA